MTSHILSSRFDAVLVAKGRANNETKRLLMGFEFEGKGKVGAERERESERERD